MIHLDLFSVESSTLTAPEASATKRHSSKSITVAGSWQLAVFAIEIQRQISAILHALSCTEDFLWSKVSTTTILTT